MFTEQPTNYAGAKPGTTAYGYCDDVNFNHRHKQPEYNDQKNREYYLDQYKKKLKEARERGDKTAIKFFKAGIRFWKVKGKKMPEHLRHKVETVRKAVDQAGTKSAFKKEAGIAYRNKYLDHILNGKVLGRDMEEINDVYVRAVCWLQQNNMKVEA